MGLPDGGFIVTWFSRGILAPNSWSLVGQRFDTSGGAVGNRFTIDSSVAPTTEAPTLLSHVVVSRNFG